MKVIPVIVAFSIEGETLKIVQCVNLKCNLNLGIDFKVAIPHVTLWMGFVQEKQLSILENEFNRAFKNVELTLNFVGIELFDGVSGKVLSATVSKERSLLLLQNKVYHFFEPHRVKPFTHDKVDELTLNYINSFGEKSLKRYEPHVTLGFSEVCLPMAMGDFIVSAPKIYLAGNNCTCLEVIG